MRGEGGRGKGLGSSNNVNSLVQSKGKLIGSSYRRLKLKWEILHVKWPCVMATKIYCCCEFSLFFLFHLWLRIDRRLTQVVSTKTGSVLLSTTPPPYTHFTSHPTSYIWLLNSNLLYFLQIHLCKIFFKYFFMDIR